MLRSIGESQFKSEYTYRIFLDGRNIIFDANVETNCGFILGEIKLVIDICLLADGDALDLVVMFDIHSNHCSRILHDVLLNWAIITGIGNLNMKHTLVIKMESRRIVEDFQRDQLVYLNGQYVQLMVGFCI